MNACPECGLRLTLQEVADGYLEQHQGSLLCIAWRIEQSRIEDMLPAGRSKPTLKRAGVRYTVVTDAIESFSNGDVVHSMRMRVYAPAYAVLISECVGLAIEYRAKVVRHCKDTPRLQRAVVAAFRVGGVPTGKRRAKDKLAQKTFFDHLLQQPANTGQVSLTCP